MLDVNDPPSDRHVYDCKLQCEDQPDFLTSSLPVARRLQLEQPGYALLIAANDAKNVKNALRPSGRNA